MRRVGRREFLGAAAVGAAGLGCSIVGGRRPNILMVIADDLTWRDCEPYGNGEVRTPNMARLASQGACFDSMFTATAMCSPTRQQLFTGMFPVRNGAYPNHSWTHDGVRSIVHHFGELGYRVGLQGKEHFGPPEVYPFDVIGERNEELDPDDPGPLEEYVNRDLKQPYFAVVASKQPHVAWNKGDASAYPVEALTAPEYLINCPHTRDALSRYYAEITYLDRQLGAALNVVDRSGRASNTIVIFTSEQGAQMPFAKWTCYDLGLRTGFIMRWPGEIGADTRVEAMAQYVDVLPTLLEAAGADPAAIETGRPDTNGKPGFDGMSFWPVLQGLREEHAQYVYGIQTTRGILSGSECYPIRSVRSSGFKYIRNLKADAEFSNVLTDRERDGHALAWLEWAEEHPEAKARAEMYIKRPTEELYDLESDPYELNNIAGDPLLSDTQEDLRRRLDEWMEQQGDLGVETEMAAEERTGAYIRKQRAGEAEA